MIARGLFSYLSYRPWNMNKLTLSTCSIFTPLQCPAQGSMPPLSAGTTYIHPHCLQFSYHWRGSSVQGCFLCRCWLQTADSGKVTMCPEVPTFCTETKHSESERLAPQDGDVSAETITKASASTRERWGALFQPLKPGWTSPWGDETSCSLPVPSHISFTVWIIQRVPIHLH